MGKRSWGERISVDPQAFGRILRQVRIKQGLSQEQLAFAMTTIAQRKTSGAHISYSWVRIAERGELKSVDTTRIMYAAEALAVPVSQLLPPPAGESETEGTTSGLIMAFRRYGMAEKDIEMLLPLIQQFTAGNQEVRLLIEKFPIPPAGESDEESDDSPDS